MRVLGRYPLGWKHTFADQNFYQDPEKLDDKRLLQYVPLSAFTYSGKGPEEERHPAETKMVSARLDKEFRCAAQSLLIRSATAERAGSGRLDRNTCLSFCNRQLTLQGKQIPQIAENS